MLISNVFTLILVVLYTDVWIVLQILFLMTVLIHDSPILLR